MQPHNRSNPSRQLAEESISLAVEVDGPHWSAVIRRPLLAVNSDSVFVSLRFATQPQHSRPFAVQSTSDFGAVVF